MRIGRPPRVHVPTVAELAEIGLAHPAAASGATVTHWRITEEGQRRIYAAMKENGAGR